MTHLTSTINMIGFCLASIIVREEKTSLFQGYRRMFVGCVRRVRGWLWFPMQVRPSNCNSAPRQRFSWYVSYIMHQKQIWFTFFLQCHVQFRWESWRGVYTYVGCMSILLAHICYSANKWVSAESCSRNKTQGYLFPPPLVLFLFVTEFSCLKFFLGL